jgi:hypothetical protein
MILFYSKVSFSNLSPDSDWNFRADGFKYQIELLGTIKIDGQRILAYKNH